MGPIVQTQQVQSLVQGAGLAGGGAWLKAGGQGLCLLCLQNSLPAQDSAGLSSVSILLAGWCPLALHLCPSYPILHIFTVPGRHSVKG